MRKLGDASLAQLQTLLQRYGLQLDIIDTDTAIPGSYWGDSEAGLAGNTLYARPDTPLHSILHEASHFICMDNARRAQLHTDAGGNDAEENAVCYLQILLAGELGISAENICRDMDEWGYSFRLGNAHAWFTQDAEDARAWLLDYEIIASDEKPTWRKK